MSKFLSEVVAADGATVGSTPRTVFRRGYGDGLSLDQREVERADDDAQSCYRRSTLST